MSALEPGRLVMRVLYAEFMVDDLHIGQVAPELDDDGNETGRYWLELLPQAHNNLPYQHSHIDLLAVNKEAQRVVYQAYPNAERRTRALRAKMEGGEA